MRDCTAAKNLLYRRLRCLANYEQANKNLDRARAKNKDVYAVCIIFYLLHLYFFNLWVDNYNYKIYRKYVNFD